MRRLHEDRAVVDALDDATVVVRLANDAAAHLHLGDTLQLRAGAQAGSAWLVDGTVDRVVFAAGTEATVHLRLVSEPRRVQQRRHVRMPAFDVELAVRRRRGDPQWFPVQGLDISAGGLRFSTDRRLAVGDLVAARVRLPAARAPVEIESDAVVVWGRLPEHQTTRHDAQYALAFRDVPPAVEDRIVAWVLRRQTSRPH